MVDGRKRVRSEVFRQAHQELRQLINAMSATLVVSELQRDASNARAMLSMLGGKLTVHLAMEDEALYPRLVNHANIEIRTRAERFKKEMGGILGAFKQYMTRWPDAESIQANGADFKAETEQIFSALRTRIAAEDDELFPRLDEG
jgi:iron-sulfur cluster repair protein YtfE (RIC family)